MNEEKINQSLLNLEKALGRLNEALKVTNKDQLMVDGTIQRFEFVIELFWKAMKRLLSYENYQVKSPREVMKQAYEMGWLRDEDAWLEMLQDRNTTSHVYDEKEAMKIFNHIKKNFPELDYTFNLLKERYKIISA